MKTPIVVRWRAYGLTLWTCNQGRPSVDRYTSGDWLATWWRFAVWRDTAPAMTVGERGVW